jgi:hypothetical protein
MPYKVRIVNPDKEDIYECLGVDQEQLEEITHKLALYYKLIQTKGAVDFREILTDYTRNVSSANELFVYGYCLGVARSCIEQPKESLENFVLYS